MCIRDRFSTVLLNQGAGFLINPLDIPGVAILVSAGRRVAGVWKPAALGAVAGIAAVSYTQLDVYKRQIECSFTSTIRK